MIGSDSLQSRLMMGDNDLMGGITFSHCLLDESQAFLILSNKVICGEEEIVVADLAEVIHTTEYLELVLRVYSGPESTENEVRIVNANHFILMIGDIGKDLPML